MHFSFPNLLDAIHKVIPESKTSKELETQIKDAMTQRFNVCSDGSKIWLRKYI
jgi:hypothetical protein